MTYYCGGYGGGTTTLVLCIGIESRPQMTNSVVVVVVEVPLYWYYVSVFSPDFPWSIQWLWLWWLYHCIGIMYWCWVKTSHNKYNGGGTMLLCIGVESRPQIKYFCGGCGGGTTVLVLCIGIKYRLHMTHSVVIVVVVVPLYWYYVLVLSQGFRWHILLWLLWWWYHCIGIMYWYLVKILHNKFSGGGYGVTVLVLCIFIESRLQMT